MAQEVIQRTFSHVLQLFQTRLYSIQPSHRHVCVVAPAARLSPPPGQWLGGGQGAEGAPGCNRLSGDKAHSLQTLLPQPRPAMALPSAEREPWLDRHVFKLQCGKPDGAGSWGRGRKERAGRSDKATVAACAARHTGWAGNAQGAVGCVWGAPPVWGNRRKGLESL